MNKLLQILFIILFPFYPFWGWLSFSMARQNVGMFVTLFFAPIAFYFIVMVNKKLPTYLILFICFTIYHLFSVYYNDLAFIYSRSWFTFLLSDFNVRACLILIVAENLVFEEKYFKILTQCIFQSIILSLIVSLIQIKYVNFFVSPEITGNDDNLLYLEQHRNFSIYSWADLNSLGITFPIFVSLLLGLQNSPKSRNLLVILSGIVVAFLTRARYAMISVMVVLSQLLISTRIAIRNKIYFLSGIVVAVMLLLSIAGRMGFDASEVIEDRILEKNTDMSSAMARVTSYNVFMLKFPEHPWWGVGPYTRQDVKDLLGDSIPIIHVGYLSYLYYYGIVGSLFFFLSLFFLLRSAWITGRENKSWGSFYGLVSLCVGNTTFVYFNLSEAGIVMAVIFLRYYTYIAAENKTVYAY